MTAIAIPLCRPNLAGREAEYLQECVTTGFVSSVGAFVRRFEEMVADVAGTADAVATSSGTTALHVALVAAGVRQGDLVVAPSFTFIATANAVSHCGAQPWLFDVTPHEWCLDAAQLRDAFVAEVERRADGAYHRPTGRRIGAIMPVYTLGLIPDMAPVIALAVEYGIPVVADAAAAVGSTRNGTGAGALADLAGFSFNGNKTVTSGGGGAVVGTNAALVARVRHLSTTARTGADYDHDAVGFNYRMTNVEAAVGCAQLENLVPFIAAKRRVRERYREGFAAHPALAAFPDALDRGNVCWFSGAVLPEGPGAVRALCGALGAAGIEARPFWKPVHLQRPYLDCPRAAMPVTEALWPRVLTLPCSTDLGEPDQSRVIEATLSAVQPLF